MCALKIFLPPKSLRDLGAMKIFAGYHTTSPQMGRRSRAAVGPAGDKAPPDWTRLEFLHGPNASSVARLAALSHASGARAGVKFCNEPCAPNACKRDDCVVRRS